MEPHHISLNAIRQHINLVVCLPVSRHCAAACVEYASVELSAALKVVMVWSNIAYQAVVMHRMSLQGGLGQSMRVWTSEPRSGRLRYV